MTIKISAQDAFSDVLAKYNAELGTAQTTTEKTSQATNGLGTAITGAIAAIGIQQVIHFAEGMQQLGDNVNIAQAQFGALTKGMGDQTSIMTGLRDATGGVVDNLDLMNASNQLLRTGVVSTSSELTQFLGDVEKLKPASMDLTSAMDTLSQTLQTGTTRGLNQFGVNIDQVKARVDQLKAAGLSASDAFKQAVFEGMSNEINKLGDAATAAETPLAKLQTQIDNLKQSLSSGFATGVEGIINFGQAVDAHSATIAQQIQLLEKLGVQGQGAATDLTNALPSQFGGRIPVAGYTQDQLDKAQQLIKVQGELYASWQQSANAIQYYRDQQNKAAQEAADIVAQKQQFLSTYQGGISQQFQGISQLGGGQSEFGGFNNQFMTQADADAVKARVDAIKADAQTMKDAFKDTITDQQKTALDGAVKSADALATAAQKAADAFKNMTLPSWLGQSNGGIGGQVEDQVLAAAQKSGMNTKNLQALQDTLDMTTGRQTTASQAEAKFASGLVGLPPDQIAKAISNYAASIQAAALAGLSSQQLAGSESFFSGLVGGGASRQIQIKPGQGLNEVMRQYGLSQAQLQAAGAYGNGILQQGKFNIPGMGQIDPNFNPQTAVDQFKTSLGTMGQGTGQGGVDAIANQTHIMTQDMQNMVNSGQQIGNSFAKLGEVLRNISNTPINLKFNITGIPDWLQGYLSSGGASFSNAMAKATQANGGVPPGSSSSKPRGGPVVAVN